MRESPRDRQLRSFAARVDQDSGRSAPCVQPKTPDGHHRENVRFARDVLPRSVQFSVATNVRFSVAIDTTVSIRSMPMVASSHRRLGQRVSDDHAHSINSKMQLLPASVAASTVFHRRPIRLRPQSTVPCCRR